MIFIRLIVAPFILMAYLIGTVVLVICAGIAWIITGEGLVSARWPSI